MEYGTQSQKELQVEGSWIPQTPHKLVLPQPSVIYTDCQGNQINGLQSGGFSHDFTRQTRAESENVCCNRPNCNWEAALDANSSRGYGSIEACRQFSLNHLMGYGNSVSCSSLLALADAAAGAPAAPSGWTSAICAQEPSWGSAISSASKIASNFAPVTPDKAMRIDCNQVPEMQHLLTDERQNHQGNKQNGIEATGMETYTPQANKELQKPVTDSSSTAVSAVYKEDAGDVIDMNKTPQQKPRRKKHRPKVITEGKSKSAQKSATPKPPASKEKPTVKRKYVRKNAVNKASATPKMEATEQFNDPRAQALPEKSCRRALNFDMGEQPREEVAKCSPTFDSDAKQQKQASISGNQSKSTVHLSHGVEVIIENSQTGIAYDLNRSVSQMLKDYVSLPEEQAPSTPGPSQVNHRQKSQEANSKGKDRVTAHDVEESTIQIMLRANPQFSLTSQNGSNYSTCTEEDLARGSKRKISSFKEPPDTCSGNLMGIQYNALPAYQTLPSVQFPGIHKKKRSEKGQGSVSSSTSYLAIAANHKEMLTIFPQNNSRRDHSTPKVNPCISTPNHYPNKPPGASREESAHPQYKQQNFGLIFSQTERSTKKRSKVPTRVRDLASLSSIAGCIMDPTNPARQVQVSCSAMHISSTQPSQTMEELVAKMCAKMTTKKRTKKRFTVVNGASSSINKEQLHGKIILFQQNLYSAKSQGTPPETVSDHVDAIAKQLKNLDINGNSSDAMVVYRRDHINRSSSNALVPYVRDGTVVPFDDSFEPIKKRRPRPKVDLDEETTRVWKLLLENINNEGIDGTDEEKAKWWEEERRVFRGRTESFIARMHLVQGDRRFTPWKGSVVDSVIGVFLTQNVSDHLSSSAFMSLASHFPIKSDSKYKSCYEGSESSEIEKPIVNILDPEDARKWSAEVSNTTIFDQSSMIHHGLELDEEREVVNSNESLGSSTGIASFETGLETFYESMANKSTLDVAETRKVSYIDEEKTATNDALSSQNSVVSYQNPEDSPMIQIAERKESRPESNTEADAENIADRSILNRLNGPLSYMELLQKVDQRNGKVSSDHNSKNECDKIQYVGNNFQRQNMDSLDCCNISLGVSTASSLEVLKDGCNDMISEETGGSNTAKNKIETDKKDHSTTGTESAVQITDQNKPATESSCQMTDQNKLSSSVQEASRSPASNISSCNSIQEDGHSTQKSQSRIIEDVHRSLAQVQNTEVLQDLSCESIHIVKSTIAFDNKGKNPPQTTESLVIDRANSGIKELEASRKAKSRRVGKEIKDNIDWDALRKQAEANGRKRERTKNTMDSLDWEAVRCADVNEIANTIKERGMNNMLAERIKAFLNRLVKEHGSIDLEWLRDVPPDKAKEYLLSIRGLGLKSVECVRLLTLHHLAFPVDTNVGRIAVRLGWVPLQPLPESLQLHLLELYPVLESIQKYLWPRLCKLDQRTLYELHYQMITFGKVFCTKSKPNCNACPMRAECRHFASAFASARLALPGPEEKSIVAAPANIKIDQNTTRMVDPLPLPPPLPRVMEQSNENQQTEANQESEAKLRDRNCEPIIEVPLSPEPEFTQLMETDIEDTFCEDLDEIPTIKLNIEQLTQNVQYYMQENMELQEHEMSKALVALTTEAASIPVPKLKNVSRLRTEHQVYELPDSHPLLEGLDRREPDDPCSYLLAIWTPGETANSTEPPSAEGRCNSQGDGKLCDDKTCFSCSSMREANSQIVRGTLLIPCRTAMRGSFPLNGTYFQVNEVFADHDSSLNPIDVPRSWIWNLQRRTVFFGTSIPTIFKGLTTEGIQHCFWRGYVCVRGFDQKTRAPRPLMARLHFPASKLNRMTKAAGKDATDQQPKLQ